MSISSALHPREGKKTSLSIATQLASRSESLTVPGSKCVFPINYQLSSDLTISQFTGPITSLPLDAMNTELGNIGVIFKQALYQDSQCACRSGWGLTCRPPQEWASLRFLTTAPFRPSTPPPAFTLAPLRPRLTLNAYRTNETINLSPFLGYYWTPS